MDRKGSAVSQVGGEKKDKKKISSLWSNRFLNDLQKGILK
jgi:hypothetical protein